MSQCTMAFGNRNHLIWTFSLSPREHFPAADRPIIHKFCAKTIHSNVRTWHFFSSLLRSNVVSTYHMEMNAIIVTIHPKMIEQKDTFAINLNWKLSPGQNSIKFTMQKWSFCGALIKLWLRYVANGSFFQFW